MSEAEIADEVRAALRELVGEIGAVSARIIEHDELRTGVPARTLALGGGEYLRVELPTRHGREVEVEAAFERTVRQLRAIRRRWEIARLPEVSIAPGAQPTAGRVIERIQGYLDALASNAPHSSHGEVVDPDAYAMSFWYNAALIVLLAEPYALDFVRYRARQVARELAHLLPLLEPDPDTPVAIGRPPNGP